MYTWTNDWATGNQTIDFQHKQLFQAINNLLEACQGGKGRDVINSTMLFLVNYTAKHFGDEEKLQQQSGYPDRVNHKKLHDNFKATVAALAQQLKTGGASIAIVGKVNSSVGNWLVNHILKEDKKVAAHLKAHGHG